MEQKEGISRVEIIDENWRSYSKWEIKSVQVDIQDWWKTMKIFINK
jgi:hypothetical protein